MQSGRVPFRVQESRRWVLGSLAGHVGFTVPHVLGVGPHDSGGDMVAIAITVRTGKDQDAEFHDRNSIE